MESPSFEQLNNFLVQAFQEILREEENRICAGPFENLSIREIHLIEAVCNACQMGADNRSSAIAHRLHVTLGTVTTAVNTLVRKGYLRRERDLQDRRVVKLFPTELGWQANEVHQDFHHQMVTSVIDRLQPEEIPVLVRALSSINQYFSGDCPSPTQPKEICCHGHTDCNGQHQ